MLSQGQNLRCQFRVGNGEGEAWDPHQVFLQLAQHEAEVRRLMSEAAQRAAEKEAGEGAQAAALAAQAGRLQVAQEAQVEAQGEVT